MSDLFFSLGVSFSERKIGTLMGRIGKTGP